MQEFDLDEIQNYKSTYKRYQMPDRQFSTTRKKLRFALMLIITLIILSIATLQWQTFLQSFATTRAEQVKKFTKIENVPMWKIVQVTE